MHRETAHPVQIRGDVETADHESEIVGHRSLQREERERTLLPVRRGIVELAAHVDDVFGELEVCLQQCVARLRHRGDGQPAHGGEIAGQAVEIFRETSTHRLS